MDDMDQLYLRARSYVEAYRDDSCAGLQRHLRLGYRAALQLKEQLAAAGLYEGIRIVREPERWSIKAVGIGGAGCNALAALPVRLPQPLEALALNREGAGALLRTRARPLAMSHANTVADDIAAIEAALAGANLVFLAAGLSGAVGSGMAPLVAMTARRMGAVVIATAYMPAAYEGAERNARAAATLEVLARDCDSVLVSSLEPRNRQEEGCSLVDLLDRRNGEFAALALEISQMLASPGVLRPSINELLLSLSGQIWMGSALREGPAAVDDALRAACAQLILRGAPAPADGMVAVLRVPPSQRPIKAAQLKLAAGALSGPETRTSIAYHVDATLATSVEVTLLAARHQIALARLCDMACRSEQYSGLIHQGAK